MLVRYTGRESELMVATLEGKDFILTFEHCKGCRKLAMILTPIDDEGEIQRRCRCTMGYSATAAQSLAGS